MPTFADRQDDRPAPAPAARRRRRDADLSQRIDGATPHELVTMLFDGARAALRAAEEATLRADHPLRLRMTTRALAILDALDMTLDHASGGRVARALTAAYAQVRALVVGGNIEQSADLFAAAAIQIDSVAVDWRSRRS